MADDQINQHKRIAMGLEGDGDFGVESLGSKAAGGPGGTKDKTLKDHERGAGPPVGHNQANPNHGFTK